MAKRRPRRGDGEGGTLKPAGEAAPAKLQRPFADALRGLTAAPHPAVAPHPAPAPGPAAAPPWTAQAVPAAPEASYEERVAARQAYAGVRPLDRGSGRPGRADLRGRAPVNMAAEARRAADAAARAADADARARLAALVRGVDRFELERDPHGAVDGVRVGAPVSARRSLRGGAAAAHVEVDLHGVSVAEVDAKLGHALRAARAQGASLVRVIHGKGLHSEDGQGVLLDAVLASLTRGASAPSVDAFVTCSARTGGEGALLLALRAGR